MRMVLIALAAIVSAQANAAISPKEAAKMASQGKAYVAEKLKDPGSAQFRNLFISEQDADAAGKTIKIHWLCGEVNGKNSYGGYTGFRRFQVSPMLGLPHIDDEDPESAESRAFTAVIWAGPCGNKVRDVR